MDELQSPRGLVLLPDVLEALRWNIDGREALLLGIVDYYLNPVWKRRPTEDSDEPDKPPLTSVNLSPKVIRRRLGFRDSTSRPELRVIHSLSEKSLLRAWKIKHHTWKLARFPVKPAEPNSSYLYIPPQVYRLLTDGELTVMEILVLAVVASFTRSGKIAYTTNRFFLHQLGIGTPQASKLIHSLERKGHLIVQLLRNGSLAALVTGHEQQLPANLRRRNPGNVGRVLWPTDGKLYKDSHWESAPKGINWSDEVDQDDEDWDDFDEY